MKAGVGGVQMKTQRQGVNPDGFIQLAAPWLFSQGFIERDLKRRPTSALKPRTQTGREQSNHRETTLIRGHLHSSVEPRKMENDTSGNATENSSDSQKTLQILRLLKFSFTLAQLSQRL